MEGDCRDVQLCSIDICTVPARHPRAHYVNFNIYLEDHYLSLFLPPSLGNTDLLPVRPPIKTHKLAHGHISGCGKREADSSFEAAKRTFPKEALFQDPISPHH